MTGSRAAKFVEGQPLSEVYPDDGGLFAEAAAASDLLAGHYEACEYSSAMREIMLLGNKANKFWEDSAPWTLKKQLTKGELTGAEADAAAGQLRDVCTIALNLFRQLAVYLAPVVPKLADQTGRLLNAPITAWSDAQTPVLGETVAPFEHMMTRVDPKKVDAMIEESKQDDTANAATNEVAGGAPTDSGDAIAKEPLVEEHCTIDDFVKVDLRVARVVSADHVEGADKLLALKLSLGGDVTRSVFAGIKSAYKPEELVGRLVIVCANLAPRKMRFGVSEGMVLAAGGGGKEIFLLQPDDGAVPGQRVH